MAEEKAAKLRAEQEAAAKKAAKVIPAANIAPAAKKPSTIDKIKNMMK